MPLESIRITAILPAPPSRVYEVWLDAAEHGEFTGGRATSDARVGGKHTSWDEYISGHNLELVPGKKIVQAWRTTEFPEGADDSRLELHLSPKGDHETTLLLVQTNIPAGQGAMYKDGWGEHYFEPLRDYLASTATRPRTRTSPAKPAASAKRVAAKRPAAPAKKATVKKPAAPAKKATAKKPAAPAKKATAKKPAATAKKATAKKATAKKR